jgi:hypothetical protein
MQIFSVNAWKYALSPGAGKWDRFTSWGEKVKDGEISIFNEETLGQMVDNFASRQNDIAMCYDHQSAYVAQNGQPAPALAFYNALALVVDGQIVKFASHDDQVAKPDVIGLENGVYGYRSEITPLGETLLPNYRYISPMFVTDGYDEAGNAVGYDLYDVACTNTPFQDAVGLTFHRDKKTPGQLPATRAKEAVKMDKELLAKLGLAEGCTPEEISKAMSQYMADSEDKIAKMEADKAADVDMMAEDKKSAEEMMVDAEQKDEDKKPDEVMDKEPDEDDMKAMAKTLGLTDDATAKAIRFAVDAKLSQLAEFSTMQDQLAKLKAEQKAAEEQAYMLTLEQFAEEAIKTGQWEEEKRDSLIAFAKGDLENAKRVLFKKGTFTLVHKNFSKQLDTRKSAEVTGEDFSTKAKAYAKDHNVELRQAQVAVAKANPELYAAYKSGK